MTYIYMHMNTNDENIWIAIEDKDVWQDERRGLDVGAEWAGKVIGARWRVARGRARWRADDEGGGRCGQRRGGGHRGD